MPGHHLRIGPAFPVVVDDSPASFEALAKEATGFVNSQPDVPNVITIGCWNEWTEGHYLLPDTDHGMGILYALADALGKEIPHARYRE